MAAMNRPSELTSNVAPSPARGYSATTFPVVESEITSVFDAVGPVARLPLKNETSRFMSEATAVFSGAPPIKFDATLSGNLILRSVVPSSTSTRSTSAEADLFMTRTYLPEPT